MKAIPKKAKKAKMSTVVQFTPTRETVKLMHEIRKVWPRRIDEARILFLMDVAGYLLNQIQGKAPRLEIGGKLVEYAKDLRIGILDEGKDEDCIAIFMDGATTEVTSDKAGKTVLYFQPHGGSPPWIPVLSKHGPWPAQSVPVLVKRHQAKIISRRAREDEITELVRRQSASKREIEDDLKKAGATNVAVGISNNGIGVVAHDDLGYNVLRKEFGFDEEPQAAHWRPAFRKTKKYAVRAMEKVVEFVKTGNNSVFDIPEHDSSVSGKVMQQGEGFAREIAPFAK